MKHSVTVFSIFIPTELAGLALGIASLGWCWEYFLNFQGKAQMSGALLASVLLLALLFKFILNPNLLKKELSHHMNGCIVPTFAMATMVVSNNINHFNHQVALYLWLSAIILHVAFLVVFIYYRIKDFKFKYMLPSWFIPPVGIVVAAVSFPGGQSINIANTILMFGLVVYFILLPILLYRYFLHNKFALHEQPTIAIFAAPASLCLTGYLTVTEQPSVQLVAMLTFIALSMTLFVYCSFNWLLRLPFSPAYSSFTFPLVIGATAMFKTNQYLISSGYSLQLAELVEYIACVELTIATLMVIYVSLRYVMYFRNELKGRWC